MRPWRYEHIGCQQHTPYCSRLNNNLHSGDSYGLLRGVICGCDPAQQVTTYNLSLSGVKAVALNGFSSRLR